MWSSDKGALINNYKVRKVEKEMIDAIDYMKDSLSNNYQKSNNCKFVEDKYGIFYLECIYQRRRYIFIPEVEAMFLKFEVNQITKESFLILVIELKADVNYELIVKKNQLVDKINNLLKENIYSDAIAGKFMILTWHYPIKNIEEAHKAMDGRKRIKKHIIDFYNKRGVLKL